MDAEKLPVLALSIVLLVSLGTAYPGQGAVSTAVNTGQGIIDSAVEFFTGDAEDTPEDVEHISGQLIEEDAELNTAEWAALASVDPDYLYDLEVEKPISVEDAIKQVRQQAVEEGYNDDVKVRYNNMQDLEKDRLEDDLDGISDPGQGFEAANTGQDNQGNVIITEDTPSPYPSDGCYDHTDFYPTGYGEFNERMILAPSWDSGYWNPDPYECPEWLTDEQGPIGSQNVDWEKLEKLRDSGAESPGNGDNGDDGETGTEIDLGYQWQNWCLEEGYSNDVDEMVDCAQNELFGCLTSGPEADECSEVQETTESYCEWADDYDHENTGYCTQNDFLDEPEIEDEEETGEEPSEDEEETEDEDTGDEDTSGNGDSNGGGGSGGVGTE